MSNVNPVKWLHISGTPDYVTECGKFIARYRKTVRGYGAYAVFAAGKRETPVNVLCVGGLPDRVYT